MIVSKFQREGRSHGLSFVKAFAINTMSKALKYNLWNNKPEDIARRKQRYCISCELYDIM